MLLLLFLDKILLAMVMHSYAIVAACSGAEEVIMAPG